MVEIVTTNIKFKFECKNCGSCCSAKDQIRVEVSPFDVYNISKHLKIKPQKFLEKYCYDKTTKNVPFFILQFPCKFFKDKCTIYEVRPMGCRTFPIGVAKIFKGKDIHLRYTLSTCPGYGKGQETCLDNFVKKSIEREEFDKEWIPLKKQLHQLIAKKKLDPKEYAKLFLLPPKETLDKSKQMLQQKL